MSNFKSCVDQVDLPPIPRLPYPGPHEATCATTACQVVTCVRQATERQVEPVVRVCPV